MRLFGTKCRKISGKISSFPDFSKKKSRHPNTIGHSILPNRLIPHSSYEEREEEKEGGKEKGGNKKGRKRTGKKTTQGGRGRLRQRGRFPKNIILGYWSGHGLSFNYLFIWGVRGARQNNYLFIWGVRGARAKL